MADPGNPRMRQGRKKLLWSAIASVLLLVAAVWVLNERPWEPRAAPVAVEVLQPGPVQQVLAVNGKVAAHKSVDVRAAVSAKVSDVHVEEGDVVAAGDTILTLDSSQVRPVVDQARAALEFGVTREQQARASAERAQALGENATRATRENTRLELAAASNEVARLRAALQQAEAQLSLYKLEAPMTGTVISGNVSKGQLVDTQTALFTIADLDRLVVEADVDEFYSARMRTGLRAILRPAGDIQPRHGRLVFTAPAVNADTGGRTIRIGFDDPVDLPVGLTVNANIIVEELDSALTVQRGSIITDDGAQSLVYVVEGGEIESRKITIEEWPAERLVVTGGLEAGDTVVLDPSDLKPGDKVVAR